MTSEERKEYADGLVRLANWVETTQVDLSTLDRVRLDLFAYNKDEFEQMASDLGGRREKVLEGSFAIVRRNFGPHKVDINIARQTVCERVQVDERVVPAVEAQPERVEPVYEWQCEGFTVTA